jgi:pimeloyl-ACP methyl ester carboxylesterase
MHVVDSGGTGAPLVLLPGTWCDDEDWDGVRKHLPPGVRTISAEFRCHGASDAPPGAFSLADLAEDILALIEHLSLERAVVAGHSLGGIVGIEMAGRSDRVAGLVLLEGWTNSRAGAAFREPRMYGSLDTAAVARIEDKISRGKARVEAADFDELRKSVVRFDGSAILRDATIPIIEVYGSMGRHAGTDAGLAVPSNPRIEWVWIEGAGHYLPHERPREVAAACVLGLRRAGYAVG